MDERGRQRLLIKIRIKDEALERELGELRIRTRTPPDLRHGLERGFALRAELEFIARWLPEFTQFALDAARSISTEWWALEVVIAHVAKMLDRFDRRSTAMVSALRRTSCTNVGKECRDEVIRKYRYACLTVKDLMDEAELEFVPESGSELTRPTLDVLDEWIRNCGTRNSKIAWEQIRAQRAFAPPLQKIFRERWQIVTGGQRRGRPRIVAHPKG